ncbi:MAG TPA: aldolase/citrate lyase family protein [Vicinamibacterales bacterium]
MTLLSRLVMTGIMVGLLLTGGLAAQRATLHLNPVIDKLSKGQPVFGLITGDLSLANARAVARAPVDFVYADMEHNPLNLDGLHTFLVGMSDKALVLKKGNLQPNVALFARFPPEADQSAWVVKQALDMGLMGVIFNGVDTKAHALAAVQSMRYPQLKGSPRFEPVGKRGAGSAIATWVWGVSTDEYERRADLWPLNPDGDLLAIVMVESAEGLKNLDEILSVPGVGMVFIGAANDLRLSLGVPASAPEVEAARQAILKGCGAHKVACGITATSGADMVKRLNEGWKMIRATEEVIRAGREMMEKK